MKIIIEGLRGSKNPEVFQEVSDMVLYVNHNDGFREVISSRTEYMSFFSDILKRRVNDRIFQLTDE